MKFLILVTECSEVVQLHCEMSLPLHVTQNFHLAGFSPFLFHFRYCSQTTQNMCCVGFPCLSLQTRYKLDMSMGNPLSVLAVPQSITVLELHYSLYQQLLSSEDRYSVLISVLQNRAWRSNKNKARTEIKFAV